MPGECSEEKYSLWALQELYSQKSHQLGEALTHRNPSQRMHASAELRDIQDRLRKAKERLDECLKAKGLAG